jgi:hypothetical protein
MTIQDREITFVVQGPVSPGPEGTARTVSSVRRHFPGSQVVLSAWPDDDLGGIGADETIVNVDPGPVVSEVGGLTIANNINRQIVSTAGGLRVTQTKYAAKVRSDATLVGRGFTALATAFPWRSDVDRIFAERIVISKQFTRSPRSFVPMAYHASDLFQFGLTSDLKDYWSVPLVQGTLLDDFMMESPPDVWFRMFDRFRFTTEQYLVLANMRRVGIEAGLRNYSHMDDAVSERSEQVVFNNFLPCEPAMLGVEHAKFMRRAQRSLAEDCSGIREFLSWYVASSTGQSSQTVLGSTAPSMSSVLKGERVARELLKRNAGLRSLYASRFLAR